MYSCKVVILCYLICSVLQTTAARGQDDFSPNGSYNTKAADLVIQGSIFELNGKFDKALSAFNEALIYEPNSASISFASARQYIWLGKVETAVRMLKRSINVDENYLDSHLLLAQIHHQKGRNKLAEQSFLEVLRIDSTNIESYLNLAQIYYSRKQHKKAAFFYEKLIDLGSGDNKIRFQLGNLYFQIKDYDSAYRTFKRYVRDYPEIEQGYLAIGAVFLAQRDTLRAIEWLEQTYNRNQHFKTAWSELANTLVMTNRWDQAIELFKTAILKDTTDLITRLRLGDLYLVKGDTVNAVQTYENIVKSHPSEWRGYFKIGLVYFSKTEWQKSVDQFEKAGELNKTLPDIWFRLGLAYQQMGLLDKAETGYRQAQKLAPRHPGVNINLGSVLMQQKKTEAAIEFLLLAVETAPDSSLLLTSALVTLADAYNALDRHDQSEQYYLKALTLDPDNATILNNYSYSLAQREERLDEALKMAEKAVEKNPENGSFLDTIGWIYFKLDDLNRALEYIKKSVEIRDTSAEVLEHLGDVYDKLGNSDLAVKSWRQAHDLEPDRQSVIIKLGIN